MCYYIFFSSTHTWDNSLTPANELVFSYWRNGFFALSEILDPKFYHNFWQRETRFVNNYDKVLNWEQKANGLLHLLWIPDHHSSHSCIHIVLYATYVLCNLVVSNIYVYFAVPSYSTVLLTSSSKTCSSGTHKCFSFSLPIYLFLFLKIARIVVWPYLVVQFREMTQRLPRHPARGKDAHASAHMNLWWLASSLLTLSRARNEHRQSTSRLTVSFTPIVVAGRSRGGHSSPRRPHCGPRTRDH